MNKKLKTLALAALLGVSSLALADIADDMDIIADNYASALKADNAGDFQQSLQKMRAAALDSRQKTPPVLDGKAEDSAEMKDYRHGMDILIGQIDQAQALANQGKLEDAKRLARDFKQTRDLYHKKYR
ncbi:cytochrome b562 [Affinibrenneria salicis]|uniref:Cytochrome b562 n=1 Tax=Affinibrenneria salicis TaxID=2590031 RepID=A0A5J5FYX7_9GAMM|nr:cytochrome b562 [Affinibrenneria salicis]KAA8999225.1 cytochrome b562 [Affinibrenneria salicis]